MVLAKRSWVYVFMKHVDVLIIGAGAAGMMCAIEAAKRGRSVTIIDHANKAGKKILMSGGGRCNFTNLYATPDNYISDNPHFCKSALSRYTQWDFIELVKKYNIPFHEKTLGQLFCDNKSKDIVEMLLAECEKAGATLHLNTSVNQIKKQDDNGYKVSTSCGLYEANALVIASGGLSIPTMGASPFAYKVAEQFDIPLKSTRAALVPFTLDVQDKERFAPLAGIGLNSIVETASMTFREHLLFTHRGLSGPAMLQISSYWTPGQELVINLAPEHNVLELLKAARQEQPLKKVQTFLSHYFPKRVIEVFVPSHMATKQLSDCSNHDLVSVAEAFQHWVIKPNGTEGWRTAEVTLGGVDCQALSSKTMEVHHHPGLYFIGEAVDVTGWLGGYNFQWAWSSGWAAGQVV
jgi:predicted Rossmann fold flavoprotein